MRPNLLRDEGGGASSRHRVRRIRRLPRWAHLALVGSSIATTACRSSAAPTVPAAALGIPTAVNGGLRFATLSTSGDEACGLTTRGAAFCWGSVWALGGSIVPVAVGGGLSFASISVGETDTCAFTPSGVAYCWGEGPLTLGGTLGGSALPVAVSGRLSFGSMGVGSQMCGVTITGAGYCWSRWNGYGQLGTGSTTASFVPAVVSGGLSLVTIRASELYNACGVTASGAAYCWGLNEFGQLGLGSATGPQRCGLTGSDPFPAGDPNNLACSLAPAKVAGGLALTQVTAGAYFTCGLTPSGAAYCWGLNARGQLGNGGTSDSTCYNGPGGYGLLGTDQDSVPCNPAPVAVSGGLAFTSISAGFQHTCALTASGVAYCWGQNYYGQLGTGTTDSSAVPIPVTGGLSFVTIGAGHAHTCALTTSGAAYCWGAMICGSEAGVSYSCAATPL